MPDIATALLAAHVGRAGLADPDKQPETSKQEAKAAAELAMRLIKACVTAYNKEVAFQKSWDDERQRVAALPGQVPCE